MTTHERRLRDLTIVLIVASAVMTYIE